MWTACALSPSAAGAEHATDLNGDALYAVAKEGGQRAVLVTPEPGDVRRWHKTDSSKFLLFRPDSGPARLELRLSVPEDGYYRIVGYHVYGPWKPGRFGMYRLEVDGVRMPNYFHGWYSAAAPAHWPKARLHVQEKDWGTIYLRKPRVLLSFFRDHDVGLLFGIDRLQFRRVSEDTLKDEDRARKVPVRATARTDSDWPVMKTEGTQSLEARFPVRRSKVRPEIDGKLDEWDWQSPEIVISRDTMKAAGRATPPIHGDADLSLTARLQWDEDAVYLAAKVRDDERAPTEKGHEWKGFWMEDGLAAFFTVPRWIVDTLRSGDKVGSQRSFGLNYYTASGPRPLPGGSEYACRPTRDGYTIEAAIRFEALALAPQAGDRLRFSVIAVDRDPSKPEGKKFGQYLWHMDRGEVRLLGANQAGVDLIPERRRAEAGSAIRYVGTADVYGEPVRVSAIEALNLATGTVSGSWPVSLLVEPGKRSLFRGALPLDALGKGRYRLRVKVAE